jgi:predicted phosphodiesterase
VTRIIIFGDVHGNWEGLLALQQAEPHPDAVLCLGDLVGYGPDAQQCVEVVRTHVAHSIAGWHDRAVADSRLRSGDELLEATWAHTRSVLAEAERDYLAGLPRHLDVELAGVRFHLSRLQPDDLDVESTSLITLPQARLRQLVEGIQADFILLGGPHIPALRQVGKQVIVCPGSLGYPRYGVPDPTFAAWQDGRVSIHHLHYRPEVTIQKLSLLPLDPEHVLRIQGVLRTGGLEPRAG